jgi:hypothetical protein
MKRASSLARKHAIFATSLAQSIFQRPSACRKKLSLTLVCTRDLREWCQVLFSALLACHARLGPSAAYQSQKAFAWIVFTCLTSLFRPLLDGCSYIEFRRWHTLPPDPGLSGIMSKGQGNIIEIPTTVTAPFDAAYPRRVSFGHPL